MNKYEVLKQLQDYYISVMDTYLDLEDGCDPEYKARLRGLLEGYKSSIGILKLLR